MKGSKSNRLWKSQEQIITYAIAVRKHYRSTGRELFGQMYSLYIDLCSWRSMQERNRVLKTLHTRMRTCCLSADNIKKLLGRILGYKQSTYSQNLDMLDWSSDSDNSLTFAKHLTVSSGPSSRATTARLTNQNEVFFGRCWTLVRGG